MKILLSKDIHLFTNITLPYMPHIIDVLKRLISCPQFVGKILLTCILFTDRVILAAYHCIEEHNFNCKLPVDVASPHCFRCKFLWNILLRRLQSVFPLFISFICVGITVFCCCLDLYKPLLCLLLMVLPSLTASAKLCSLNS